MLEERVSGQEAIEPEGIHGFAVTQRQRALYSIGCIAGNSHTWITNRAMVAKIRQLLSQIGAPPGTCMQSIERAASLNEFLGAEVYKELVDAVRELPELLEQCCTTEDYRYFEFGKSLYLTCANREFSDYIGQELWEVRSCLRDVERLAGDLPLAPLPRFCVDQFVKAVRSKVDPADAYDLAADVGNALGWAVCV